MPRSTTDSFDGVIGDDWRTSTPWWSPEPRPADGSPNIVLVVLDDVGFGQLGCYGSDIDTPVIDDLAATGVKFARFHTTALCSPTRACLLTGRNHHRNGLGRVADLAMGFPGYDGQVPRENGFLSEILRDAGYATYAVGKWHLTPDEDTHMGASRETWPLGRGFDRWYGFHGGETHQFVPALYHDNHSVQPPSTIEEGYHLSADLADRAIGYVADLRSVDPDRPFFLYFATGACHSPHQAPPEWIERYRGRFDLGWDEWRDAIFRRQLEAGLLPPGTVLPPRPSWVPAWDELPPDQQRVAGALHGVLRRVPRVHRRADRSPPRLPRRHRRPRRHDRRRRVRQRRELGGRARRIAQRRAAPERRPDPAHASSWSASTSWAARRPTTTTRGDGRWPATRRSVGGSARSTKAGSRIR